MFSRSIIKTCRFYAVFAFCTFQKIFTHQTDDCKLPDAVKNEIKSFKDFTTYTYEMVTEDFKNQYYQALADFIDAFGSRLAGSENHNNAIDYLHRWAYDNQLQPWNESFEIPHWKRGNEMAEIINPQRKKLDIIGLGFAGNTPPEGISADVVVVSNFTELEELGSKVKNKIVLFNANFTSYHETVIYRTQGPARASKLGAIAALVRSVTPLSIFSLHAGLTNFGECDKVIPAAAVTLEDADYMDRMHKNGKNLRVWLRMDGRTSGIATTNNLFVEFSNDNVDEYVVLSAHTDSWDVGQGVINSGANAFLVLFTIKVAKQFLYGSRKNILGTLWGAEEFGHLGSEYYKTKHWQDIPKWDLIYEASAGTLYNPIGFNIDGNHDAYCIIQEIASLFNDTNATQAAYEKYVGDDANTFKNYSIPIIGPRYNSSDKINWLRNTAGDSLTALDPDILDRNLAVTVGIISILADLSFRLPRGNESIWNFFKY